MIRNNRDREQLLNSTIEVNGEDYYYLHDFAELTNRSCQAIRLAILTGNRLDKLRAEKIGESVIIPASELTRFPFCSPGKNKRVSFYTADGQEVTRVIETTEEWKLMQYIREQGKQQGIDSLVVKQKIDEAILDMRKKRYKEKQSESKSVASED